jgi:dTDP-4-dehydrorhamnose 3,5-epimerase
MIFIETNLPESARGVHWNDPAFGIEWPSADQRVISMRDQQYPDVHL